VEPIVLSQGGTDGYLRGRITGLLADSGQSAWCGIEATGFLLGGHLPPLSYRRGAMCQ